jgi:hypothetical protein
VLVALALDLVDIGFKPSEIVFLLRYLRPKLEQQFEMVLRDRREPGRRAAASGRRQVLSRARIFDEYGGSRKVAKL